MVIVITGAASGLGWAMAQRWHGQGHDLVLADIDGAGLNDRIETLGERAVGCRMDITCREDIGQLVDVISAHYGRLDLLVNNAGITHRSKATETSPDVMSQVMAVNWQGPIELTQRCLALLKAARGTVLCMGSMAGWMPVPGRAGYCAAKAALSQYFEVLRLELEADGVHVLMVYPSFVSTPIETNALGPEGEPAGHSRSVTGSVATPVSVAADIDRAWHRGRKWLFYGARARLGSVLWRLVPAVYQRLVRREFAGEL